MPHPSRIWCERVGSLTSPSQPNHCHHQPETRLALNSAWRKLHQLIRSTRIATPVSSKSVVERHGLSTSTIPRGAIQEEKNTEYYGHNKECPKASHKCTRLSECHRRCESSEKSSV